MPREREFNSLQEHVDHLFQELPRELYACIKKYERWSEEEMEENESLKRIVEVMTKKRNRMKNLKRMMTAESHKNGSDSEKYTKYLKDMYIELLYGEYILREFQNVSMNEIGVDLTYGI